MPPLPEADAATRAVFLDWLDTFAGHVRAVDYAAARPLFHPDVLAFGTHRDVIPGLEPWISTQWDNVWPKTSDFRFDLDAARILTADDASMACVVVPWTSRVSSRWRPIRPPRPRHDGLSSDRRRVALHPFAYVAEPGRAAGKPRRPAG